MPSIDSINHLKVDDTKNFTTKEIERRKEPQKDENNFELLPNEIVMKIFEKLRNKDQRNLTKVCRRFNDLLIDSKQFLLSSKLLIDADLRLTSAFDFPISSVSIRQSWKAHIKKRSRKIIKAHHQTIQSLSIDRAEVYFVIRLLDILEENLTSLTLQFIEKSVDFPYNKIRFDLPNLKILKLNYAAKFLCHIKSHKIEEMEVRNGDEEVIEISNFLGDCELLKRLTLENFLPIYNAEIHHYKLETLKILSAPERLNLHSMKSFLNPHKESLKKFQTDGTEFTRFALKEMNLEELWCPHENSFDTDEYLKPSKSIKKLRLNYVEYPPNSIHKLIEACKAVESFRLDCEETGIFPRATLLIASQNMKNLKNLTIERLTSFIHSMSFESVESLRILKVHSKNEHKSWISLSLCCPKLRKIFINQSHEGTDESFIIDREDIKNLLEGCESLEELHIGGNFDISEEFVEAILKCELRSFWYLRIESENFEEDAEMARKFEGSKVRCEIVRKAKEKEEEDD